MAGVREKKKAQTQKAIINAAMELFSEKGYNDTKIEDIAEKAVCGVGTVYNYFGSKQGLLLEMSHMVTQEALTDIEKLIEKPHSDPETGIFSALWLITEELFRFDKKLLRQIMIVVIMEPEDIGKDIMADDMRIMQKLAELVGYYQSVGKINSELPVEASVMVLYSTLMMVTQFYLALDVDKKALKKTMKDYIHIIFLDWKGNGGGLS